MSSSEQTIPVRILMTQFVKVMAEAEKLAVESSEWAASYEAVFTGSIPNKSTEVDKLVANVPITPNEILAPKLRDIALELGFDMLAVWIAEFGIEPAGHNNKTSLIAARQLDTKTRQSRESSQSSNASESGDAHGLNAPNVLRFSDYVKSNSKLVSTAPIPLN